GPRIKKKDCKVFIFVYYIFFVVFEMRGIGKICGEKYNGKKWVGKENEWKRRGKILFKKMNKKGKKILFKKINEKGEKKFLFKKIDQKGGKHFI
ncbi:hypothetical protein RFI_15823, partial [Reticulomyxa filosa]